MGSVAGGGAMRDRLSEGKMYEGTLGNGGVAVGKLIEPGLTDGRLNASDESVTVGMLIEPELTDGRLSAGSVKEGRPIVGKLADGKPIEFRLAEGAFPEEEL